MMAYTGGWSAIVDRTKVNEGPKGELTGRAACESAVSFLPFAAAERAFCRAALAFGISIQVVVVAQPYLPPLCELELLSFAPVLPC